MSEIDDFQAALASANTAFLASDFTSARKYITSARIILAGIPNGGNDNTTFNFRSDLEKIAEAINDAEARTSTRTNTIQRSLVTNVEPS